MWFQRLFDAIGTTLHLLPDRSKPLFIQHLSCSNTVCISGMICFDGTISTSLLSFAAAAAAAVLLTQLPSQPPISNLQPLLSSASFLFFIGVWGVVDFFLPWAKSHRSTPSDDMAAWFKGNRFRDEALWYLAPLLVRADLLS